MVYVHFQVQSVVFSEYMRGRTTINPQRHGIHRFRRVLKDTQSSITHLDRSIWSTKGKYAIKPAQMYPKQLLVGESRDSPQDQARSDVIIHAASTRVDESQDHNMVRGDWAEHNSVYRCLYDEGWSMHSSGSANNKRRKGLCDT